MTGIPRSARLALVALTVFGGFELGGGLGESRAGIVVSTLDLPDDGTFPGEQVGAAIQIGSTPISLESIVYLQAFSLGPAPGETFAIFSRNADGTVGSSLFDAFTLNFDMTTFTTTATATSPFTFQANTSYWLMMVETPGVFGDWDNSLSFTYTSAFGVTIPDQNTSVSFFSGTVQYLNASDGLQIFQVNGSAIPEPSTLALALAGSPVVVGICWLRRRRSTG
jgi:hypothetical protein